MITKGRTEIFPLNDVAHVRQALVMLPRFEFHDILEKFLVYWRVRQACEWFGISPPAHLIELVARLDDASLLRLWQYATAAWNAIHIIYLQSFVASRPQLLALADVATSAR
jgi:hypothetical protein